MVPVLDVDVFDALMIPWWFWKVRINMNQVKYLKIPWKKSDLGYHKAFYPQF